MFKLIDYLSLPLSLFLATYIRFKTTSFDLREIYLLATSLLAWSVASRVFNLYKSSDEIAVRPHRFGVVVLFFFIMTGFSFYTQKELNFSRVVLVIFTTFQYAIPLVISSILNLLHIHVYPKNRRLIIGSGSLFHNYKKNRRDGVEDFVNIDNNSKFDKIITSSYQEVFVVFDRVHKSINNGVVKACQEVGARCFVVLDNKSLSDYSLQPTSKGRQTLFTPLINRLDDRDNRIMKRLFDILFSLVGTILLSPILLLTALFIKLSDFKSPVFFTQERTGYNQKRFKVYKFRSMRVVDRDIADREQATKDDPRITNFGAFLRRTNIDELPQLFNVLRGDMSLVGPRPHPIVMDEYQELIPDYLLRHFVVPGITGWAQVNGFRGVTDTKDKMEKRVEYDLWYVENWSLWLDIKIIWLTIFSRKSYENAV